MQIALIQPRSPWGEHPYLPNGILSVAARLKAVGVSSHIIDENLGDRLADPLIDDALSRSDVIGIGVLGSPYIPSAIRVAAAIRRKGYPQPILFGGEVIMRLTNQQFMRVFGHFGDVQQIGHEDQIGDVFGIKRGNVPSMYDTSIGSIVQGLPRRMQTAYFKRPWCLFTSQGCIYNCDFCAATKDRRERFRQIEALSDEVRVLARVVKSVAGSHPPYEVYCSTLDGCQTPIDMERTFRIVGDLSRTEGVHLRLRFLATAAATVSAENRFPGYLSRLRDNGLVCVGIGVDGDDPVVWAREHKSHNTRPKIAQAFDLIARAKLQAEALMVIGFPGDDITSLFRSCRASFRFARHGVTPRPYLGKAHAPGSKGWTDGGPVVERLLNNPGLFKELDYGGLGSSVTHPDVLQRYAANAAFFVTTMALKLKAFSLNGCPTQPLFPTESPIWPFRVAGRLWNRAMPQDR